MTNSLGWDELHNQLLNWTYSLYMNQFSGYAHLSNLGYFGRPDPTLEIEQNSKKKTVTPDFIATDKKEIVQIHDIKGFEKLMQRKNDNDIAEKIEQEFQKISDYRNVTKASIKSFFSKHKIDLKNITIELIAVMDFDFYIRHKKAIDSCAKKSNIIIWTIDTNQKRIRKHAIHHLDKKLDQIFKPSIVLPIQPRCPILVLFTRQTDRRVKTYHFTANLISALVQNSQKSVKFSEIDNIMVHSSPPKYAHLVPDEREKEWITFLFEAINRDKILKKSEKGPDMYELQNPAILESPYSANKLLEDLSRKLRIIK